MKFSKVVLALLCSALFAPQFKASAQSFLTNGLIAYYPFSGNANDASGQGNDGIVHGFDLAPDRYGQPNSAFASDSTTNFVGTTTQQAPLNIFTISVWFKTTNSGSFVGFSDSQSAPGGSLTKWDRVIGMSQDGSGRLDGYRQRVGMVFQQFNIRPNPTVIANLTLAPRAVLGRSTSELGEEGFALLRQVGLTDKTSAYARALSGDQQQRLLTKSEYQNEYQTGWICYDLPKPI